MQSPIQPFCRATASLVYTTSPPRRGDLVRQAVQHAEHGFHAVAGEERKRRYAERADGIGDDVLGGRLPHTSIASLTVLRSS